MAAAAIVAALLLSTDASAGWRYTEWSMTPADVVAASGGAARPVDPPERIDSGLLVGALQDVQIAQYRLTAYFLFHPERRWLELVSMVLAPPGPAPDLYDTLVARYGEPYFREGEGSGGAVSLEARWRNPADNLHVFYYRLDDRHTLEIRPLHRLGAGAPQPEDDGGQPQSGPQTEGGS